MATVSMPHYKLKLLKGEYWLDFDECQLQETIVELLKPQLTFLLPQASLR